MTDETIRIHKTGAKIAIALILVGLILFAIDYNFYPQNHNGHDDGLVRVAAAFFVAAGAMLAGVTIVIPLMATGLGLILLAIFIITGKL